MVIGILSVLHSACLFISLFYHPLRTPDLSNLIRGQPAWIFQLLIYTLIIKANETYTKFKLNSEQLYGKYHVIVI